MTVTIFYNPRSGSFEIQVNRGRVRLLVVNNPMWSVAAKAVGYNLTQKVEHKFDIADNLDDPMGPERVAAMTLATYLR
jgi:hypothetical protein